jgi:predicted RNA polymerase sigma factor
MPFVDRASPVVTVRRALAVGLAEGPAAGLALPDGPLKSF